MAKKKIEEQEVELVEAQEAEEVEEKAEDELMQGEDGKELLFPGGPTIEKVEEWKSLHNDEVYLTEFENDVIVWRTMNRKEYKEIMKIQGADQFYREERICDKCVLWPESYGFMEMRDGSAGVPTVVAELIMEKSGFQARTQAMKL